MFRSILAEQDRLSIDNGMYLTLLSARELLDARREARNLAKGALEQPLCSNACLVAKALRLEGSDLPLFCGGEEVLDTLTADEIEILAARWDGFRRVTLPEGGSEIESGINASFDPSRFQTREVSGR